MFKIIILNKKDLKFIELEVMVGKWPQPTPCNINLIFKLVQDNLNYLNYSNESKLRAWGLTW